MCQKTNELVNAWLETKQALDLAKARELKLRNQIEKEIFADAKLEGTSSFDLGSGYKIKINKKINYKLKYENLEEVEQLCEAFAKIPEGSFIFKRLVAWEAKLSTAEYKKLDHEFASLIDPFIESKPALATLEFVEPKQLG